MEEKEFYAVASGEKPGVYYSWEDCRKQLQGSAIPVFKKFLREKDAWDFVKITCPNVKLTAGTSPAKRKINSQGGSLRAKIMKLDGGTGPAKRKLNIKDGRLRTNILKKLREIEVRMKDFRESISKQVASIREELLAEHPFSHPIKRRFDTRLPSTSKKCRIATSDIPEGEKISSFRVDNDGYVEVYTDGACTKNGRKGAKAGIGVWFGDGHSLNISRRVSGRVTNNSAEIEAATLAIETASQAGIKKLKLYTDSTFLISAITEWIHRWKRNNWKTMEGQPVKNKEELILLDKARQGLDVVFVKVRGHAGIYGNIRADALAKNGVKPKKSALF